MSGDARTTRRPLAGRPLDQLNRSAPDRTGGRIIEADPSDDRGARRRSDINEWTRIVRRDPGHSARYIERFRRMAAAGDDLGGEARFVDAMVTRGARVLDAGSGTGRVGGRLATAGHDVVGIDLDPTLVAAAERDHPDPRWLVGDLAELDLPSLGIVDGFDAIVCAGNVVTFLAPDTRRQVLRRLGVHLRGDGRLAIGFGTDRGYDVEDFFADVRSVGLSVDLSLATWDLRPFVPGSGFLVAVLSRVPG